MLSQAGPRLDEVRQLRPLATVAAWRAGAAHARAAALAAAEALPPAIACLAVGATETEDWALVAARFAANRWWSPAPPRGEIMHRVGGFAGFGGAFSEPPRLFAQGESFVAVSGDRRFWVNADAFGATIRRSLVDEVLERGTAGGTDRLEGAVLHADDRSIELGAHLESLAVAESADALAVSSALSHVIRIFPKALP